MIKPQITWSKAAAFLCAVFIFASVVLTCGCNITSIAEVNPEETNSASPEKVETDYCTKILTETEYNQFYSDLGYTYIGKKQSDNGNEIAVYAFSDKIGEIRYRAVSVESIFENNVLKEKNTFFVEVTFNKANIAVISDELLPREASDVILGLPEPCQPERVSVPSGYISLEDIPGCYYFISIDNEKIFRRYAAFLGKEPMFFPCDSLGVIRAGALPIDYYDDSLIIDFDKSVQSTDSVKNTPSIESTPIPKNYFVKDAPFEIVSELKADTLINLNHRFLADYIPENMIPVIDYIDEGIITLDFEYTFGNKEAVLALNEMLKAAKAEGVTDFYLRNVYRSYETQERLWNRRVAANPDYGRVKGSPLGSAYPGTSEHQSGYAFDITCLEAKEASNRFQYTKQYEWLKSNSYKYGFTLRYAADKTAITGIIFEPYHFRFVGKELAKYLFENNICLEEYWESPIQW